MCIPTPGQDSISHKPKILLLVVVVIGLGVAGWHRLVKPFGTLYCE